MGANGQRRKKRMKIITTRPAAVSEIIHTEENSCSLADDRLLGSYLLRNNEAVGSDRLAW